MATLEVLCATMHQTDFSKIKEMNINSNVIFANQCDCTAYEELEFNGHTAKMISTRTRGVGKNRNLALLYASADICLFADDDVVYFDNYESKICNFYEQHPDADVVIFNFLVSRNGGESCSIVNRTRRVNRKTLSYGTYAISCRKSAIDWHNISFHHQFGGGAYYSCGEDSIFLSDCFDSKLKIYTCSETIGMVNHQESTWFNGYTDRFFADKGALFYLLMGYLAIPSIVYHCIKHKNTYANISIRKTIVLMIQGAKKAKMLSLRKNGKE